MGGASAVTISRTNFDEVSENDLIALVEAEKAEGLDIEYKREPYGASDHDKKEALKDISSFANTGGGHLIIGMEEKDGIPVATYDVQNPDNVIQRLESLIRDCVEPRILGIRLRPVALKQGGVAIVVRIPKSWNPPHRVSIGNSNRFWVRNSGGAHEASVEELRVLFNSALDTHHRIRQFRDLRIGTIQQGRGPTVLPGDGRLFLHLVPLSAPAILASVDLDWVYKNHRSFRPLGATGMTPRFNLDGVINMRGGEQCFGYTQVFRSGIVEATKASILIDWRGTPILHAGEITIQIVESIETYLDGLNALGVSPPIVVMISFDGVSRAKLGLKGYDNRLEEINTFPTNEPLLLPEIVINDYGPPQEYSRAIRPAFDVLWNGAGFSRCTHYNNDGDWAPPR